MIIIATVVFLYYTIWTLFMVPHFRLPPVPTPLLTPLAAVRGREHRAAQLLPAARMGDPNPDDHHPRRNRGRGELPQHGHDQECAEEEG